MMDTQRMEVRGGEGRNGWIKGRSLGLGDVEVVVVVLG